MKHTLEELNLKPEEIAQIGYIQRKPEGKNSEAIETIALDTDAIREQHPKGSFVKLSDTEKPLNSFESIMNERKEIEELETTDKIPGIVRLQTNERGIHTETIGAVVVRGNNVEGINSLSLTEIEGAEWDKTNNKDEISNLAIAVKVANILSNLEKHGKIHRDIKPANIMVTPRGEVTLVDIGTIKKLNAGGYIEEKDIAITPMYGAPEKNNQMIAIENVAMDIYSVTASLAHVLGIEITGYWGEIKENIANSELSEKTKLVLTKGMEEQPQKRIRNFETLSQALALCKDSNITLEQLEKFFEKENEKQQEIDEKIETYTRIRSNLVFKREQRTNNLRTVLREAVNKTPDGRLLEFLETDPRGYERQLGTLQETPEGEHNKVDINTQIINVRTPDAEIVIADLKNLAPYIDKYVKPEEHTREELVRLAYKDIDDIIKIMYEARFNKPITTADWSFRDTKEALEIQIIRDRQYELKNPLVFIKETIKLIDKQILKDINKNSEQKNLEFIRKRAVLEYLARCMYGARYEYAKIAEEQKLIKT